MLAGLRFFLVFIQFLTIKKGKQFVWTQNLSISTELEIIRALEKSILVLNGREIRNATRDTHGKYATYAGMQQAEREMLQLQRGSYLDVETLNIIA